MLTSVRIPGVVGVCKRSSAKNIKKVTYHLPLHTPDTEKSFVPTSKHIFQKSLQSCTPITHPDSSFYPSRGRDPEWRLRVSLGTHHSERTV